MPRPTKSQKAFTLIEVMLAATVLLVSFTAVIQTVTIGAEMVDTARKQQIAQQIIDGEMTYQKTIPWSQTGPTAYGVLQMPNSTFRIRINTAGTAIDDTSNGYNDLLRFGLDDNAALLSAAKGFTVEVESTNDVPSPMPPIVEIVWTVTWNSTAGRVHTRTGKGYYSEFGLRLSYQK